MAEYMLDTDIASYIMGSKSRTVLEKLQTVPTSAVCISAITKSEITYGVEISPRRERDRAALEFLLRHVQVLDYPVEAAADYGQIRAALRKLGRASSDGFLGSRLRTGPSRASARRQVTG